MNRRLALLPLLAFLIAGCASPRPPAEGSPDGVFPHPEGFEASHARVEDGGSAACASCHALDVDRPVRGVTPVAPACRSCHAVYPHQPEMADGAVHALAWSEGGETCVGCHGSEGERDPGGTGRLCSSCHSTYPHPDLWEEPAGHGTAQLSRGGPVCTGCHGVEGTRIAEADCAECHAAYPHGDDQADPAVHAAPWLDDPEQCGAACHDTSEATQGRVSCTSCHDLFPHPEDWASSHRVVAQQRGELVCRSCHPAGVPSTPLPLACGAGCHDGSAP